MRPFISVVTATRNVEGKIDRLFGSLQRQTYKDFEWVVADGLSRDGTLGRLREYAACSSWTRFSSEADFGVYDALNKAIKASQGEFYVVAGADDEFDPEALRNYADFVTGTAADVVLAQVQRNGRVIGGFHPRRAWLGTARAFGGSHSVGMLIRKDLHGRFGIYSPRFPLLADVHFLKVLLRSRLVQFSEAQFIAGTFAEGGLTTVNKLQILAENWQIQMLTERHPLLQTALFLGKIAVRYLPLQRELRQLRQANGAERRPEANT